MREILKWLDLTRRGGARVGLRPHHDVELGLPYGAAHDALVAAIDRVLGANLTLDDRSGGLIEAGFGLIGSERLRCTLRAVDAGRTAIHIEAIYRAGTNIPERSRNVEALAAALATG